MGADDGEGPGSRKRLVAWEQLSLRIGWPLASLHRPNTEVLVELAQGPLGYDLPHLGKANVGAGNLLMMAPIGLAPPRRFVTVLDRPKKYSRGYGAPDRGSGGWHAF